MTQNMVVNDRVYVGVAVVRFDLVVVGGRRPGLFLVEHTFLAVSLAFSTTCQADLALAKIFFRSSVS